METNVDKLQDRANDGHARNVIKDYHIYWLVNQSVSVYLASFRLDMV